MAYDTYKCPYDSSKMDSTFTYYSYNNQGNLIGVYYADEGRKEKSTFDALGNLTFHLKIHYGDFVDTSEHFVAKYDNESQCTSFYLKEENKFYFQAINVDSTTLHFPNRHTETFRIIDGASSAFCSQNDFYILKKDTFFYYVLNVDYKNNSEKWDLEYFAINQKTKNGFTSRMYSVKNDTVFYYGVSNCITHVFENHTLIDTCYNFVFDRKNIDLKYDPKFPHLENKIIGKFIIDGEIKTYYYPSNPIIGFTRGDIRGTQKIEPIYPSELWTPPYNDFYREEHSLKTLKKRYQHVSIIEHY